MSDPSSSSSSNTYNHMDTVRYIDADQYNAAIQGKFDPFRNYQEPLDSLLTPDGNTILHIHLTSLKESSKYFIKEVVNMCPQLLMQANEEANTPLHVAVMYGHSTVAEVLIERTKALFDKDLESGEVNAVSAVRQMLRMTNKNKDAALHIAARRKNFKVVKAILDNEDPEFTYFANRYRESPLYLAANSILGGQIIVEILRTFKSVEVGGPGGRTALHAAIFWKENVAEILRKRKSLAAKVDDNGWTPLHCAVCRDSLSTVKILLDADESAAYVADKDRKMTALHVAACRGNKRIVSEIISKCPNCCELVDVHGWNVLHFAVISQSIEVLEAAIKSSSFISHLLDMKDEKGYTPIDFISVSNRMRKWVSNRAHGAIESEGGDPFILDIWANISFMDSNSQQEILEWMKDIDTGPYGKIVEEQRELDQWIVPDIERGKDAHPEMSDSSCSGNTYKHMNTVRYIKAELHRAAIEGNINPFRVYQEPLDRLLTPNRNTILHIHLTCPEIISEDFIKEALKMCPQLLVRANVEGNTPLHMAAMFGHSNAAKVIIEQAKAFHHHIHLTCPEIISEDFVKEAFEMCPQLLVRANVEGNTPLHMAAMFGHSNTAKVIIEQAKALHDKHLEEGEFEVVSAVRQMLRMTNNNEETAFHIAAQRNNLEVVKLILDNEDPEFTYSANSYGESPLYLAANSSTDNPDNNLVVAILNTFNLSVNFGGPRGKTALHAAISRNRFVKEILEARNSLASEADENGWTPLHYAVCLDDFSLVAMLLDADKSAAYVADKERKMTALHMAARGGNEHIVREIISRCPDCCELIDVNGWNVFHYAVISQRFKVLEEVYKSSSSTHHLLHTKDGKGYTPIEFISVSHRMRDRVAGAKKSGLKDAYNKLYMDSNSKKEILEWMKDIGTGPYGEIINSFEAWEVRLRQEITEIEEQVVPKFQKARESHLVAAALVATVTFAAGFTLPGGYVSDENNMEKGTPILSRNAAFKAFVISDAMAFVFSTYSVFIQFIMVMLGYQPRYFWLMRSGLWFILFAMAAMVVAFVTGTYAVLAGPSRGLAITTSVIGLCFFIYGCYTTIRLVVESVRRNQAEDRRRPRFVSLLGIWRQSPLHFSIIGWRLEWMVIKIVLWIQDKLEKWLEKLE